MPVATALDLGVLTVDQTGKFVDVAAVDAQAALDAATEEPVTESPDA